MAIPAQAPADTAMMNIVHSALRRDLTRTSEAVSANPPPGDEQRQAIAGHVVWMMDFLHRHHAGEDDGLWPLVRRHDPTAGALLDDMDADHVRIAPQLESVTAAGKPYGSDSSPQARAVIARCHRVAAGRPRPSSAPGRNAGNASRVEGLDPRPVGGVQPGALRQAEVQERVGSGRPLADRQHRPSRLRRRGQQRPTHSALRATTCFRRPVSARLRRPMGT